MFRDLLTKYTMNAKEKESNCYLLQLLSLPLSNLSLNIQKTILLSKQFHFFLRFNFFFWLFLSSMNFSLKINLIVLNVINLERVT